MYPLHHPHHYDHKNSSFDDEKIRNVEYDYSAHASEQTYYASENADKPINYHHDTNYSEGNDNGRYYGYNDAESSGSSANRSNNNYTYDYYTTHEKDNKYQDRYATDSYYDTHYNTKDYEYNNYYYQQEQECGNRNVEEQEKQYHEHSGRREEEEVRANSNKLNYHNLPPPHQHQNFTYDTDTYDRRGYGYAPEESMRSRHYAEYYERKSNISPVVEYANASDPTCTHRDERTVPSIGANDFAVTTTSTTTTTEDAHALPLSEGNVMSYNTSNTYTTHEYNQNYPAPYRDDTQYPYTDTN